MSALAMLVAFTVGAATTAVHAQTQPNIVPVFMDNFGWGEPGFNGVEGTYIYEGTKGSPPRTVMAYNKENLYINQLFEV